MEKEKLKLDNYLEKTISDEELAKKIKKVNSIKSISIYGKKWKIALFWFCSTAYALLGLYSTFPEGKVFAFIAAFLYFLFPFISATEYQIVKNEVEIELLKRKIKELQS